MNLPNELWVITKQYLIITRPWEYKTHPIHEELQHNLDLTKYISIPTLCHHYLLLCNGCNQPCMWWMSVTDGIKIIPCVTDKGCGESTCSVWFG